MNAIVAQGDYIWVATMDDGNVIQQMDPVGSGLTNFNTVDLEHCKEIAIVPFRFKAPGKPKNLPTIRVLPQLDKGERAFWHWLVDIDTATGDKFYRHVVGLQLPDGSKIYTVTVSLTGEVSICTNEDLAPTPNVW